jgi:integrase
MASIINDPADRKRVQFFGPDGKRRTIRLGKCSDGRATKFVNNLEEVLLARDRGHLDRKHHDWLDTLSDKMHTKLAKFGVVEPRARAAMTLGEFIAEYLSTLTGKPNTLRNYQQVGRALTDFMGADKPLRQVSAPDGDRWQRWMRSERTDAEGNPAPLSEATISKWTTIARRMFRKAVAWGQAPASPFADLVANTSKQKNRDRQFFVARDVAQRVIDKCPDSEWKLIVALARYGGLRCPTEVLALRWEDINWEAKRILVHSPKTEHHAGGATRPMPLFAELEPHLLAVFTEAHDDDGTAPAPTEHVITRHRIDNRGNLRTQFARIIRLAGVELWPKLFNNLRSTRQTELCNTFPAHVVCRWLGNSRDVADDHYLQVTDEHFAAAVNSAEEKAAHYPAQSAAAGKGQQGTHAAKGAEIPLVSAGVPYSPTVQRSPQESNL